MSKTFDYSFEAHDGLQIVKYRIVSPLSNILFEKGLVSFQRRYYGSCLTILSNDRKFYFDASETNRFEVYLDKLLLEEKIEKKD